MWVINDRFHWYSIEDSAKRLWWKKKTLSQTFYGVLNTSQKQPFEVFFKIGVLKNLAMFKRKHLCWSFSLIKLHAFSPATLLKRDSNTGVFLWYCKIFKSSFFYRTPPVALFVELMLDYLIWEGFSHIMFHVVHHYLLCD